VDIGAPQTSTSADASATSPSTEAVAQTDGEQRADGSTDPAASVCDGLVAVTAGSVELDSLVETSGLAASRQHPGIVWAHNDSGQATEVSAIGPSGEHRATFALGGIDGVDIEDIAVHDGELYLADIGDNDSVRESVAVYRFAEPDPAAGDGVVTGVEVIELRYPGGARDAEAFAVDPATGELIIIEKAFGFAPGGGLVTPTPASIFVAPSPGDAAGATDGGTTGEVTELTATGTVAMTRLAAEATGEAPPDAIFTRLGLEGVVTAADIRGDGRLIAIRTYATVWLFGRSEGQSVAEALASTPCEAPTVVEEQGESVAFLHADTAAFVTASEGSNPAWNVTSGP
jgi:hypothetical protein